jgi:hypothetical protein
MGYQTLFLVLSAFGHSAEAYIYEFSPFTASGSWALFLKDMDVYDFHNLTRGSGWFFMTMDGSLLVGAREEGSP